MFGGEYHVSKVVFLAERVHNLRSADLDDFSAFSSSSFFFLVFFVVVVFLPILILLLQFFTML